nr:MAG: hypothetical protein [Molluscum contagiosum virus]
MILRSAVARVSVDASAAATSTVAVRSLRMTMKAPTRTCACTKCSRSRASTRSPAKVIRYGRKRFGPTYSSSSLSTQQYTGRPKAIRQRSARPSRTQHTASTCSAASRARR